MTMFCTRKRSIFALTAALAVFGTSVAEGQKPEVQRLFQSGAYNALSRDLFGSYSQFWAESMQAQVENAAEVQQRTLEQATKQEPFTNEPACHRQATK